MQIFLIIVHVIVCLFLIAVILLQAGRGGGLSDMAGGGQAQSILGTETNTFMKRLTEVFAVVFIITSLSLGIISTHRGKSLVQQQRLMENFKKNIPFSEAQKASKDSKAPKKDATAATTATTTAPVAVSAAALAAKDNATSAAAVVTPTAPTNASQPAASAAPTPSAPVLPSAAAESKPADGAQAPAEGNAK